MSTFKYAENDYFKRVQRLKKKKKKTVGRKLCNSRGRKNVCEVLVKSINE